MSLTPPPTPPSSSDPATFDARADAMLAWLAQNVTEMNAFQASITAIAAGGGFTIPYTFSTITTDSDPGAGALRLDNATQNAATTIRVDLLGADATTWTAVLDAFDDSSSAVKGQIRLVKLADASKWILFNVGTVATPAGYRNIAVTVVAASSASPFVNGDSVALQFTRTGDKGDVGNSSVGIVRSARTANTILAAGDFNKLIDVTSGTFTQTLTAAASLGATWSCFYKNSGSGVITLDPNSAETINGAATLLVNPGDVIIIECDGSAFYATQLAGSTGYAHFREVQASGTAGSSHASGTFTQVLNTTVENTIVGCSLASNAITLPAGIYDFEAFCPVVVTGLHQSYLVNHTDNAVLIRGINNGDTIDMIHGRFSLSASKAIRLDTWSNASAVYGQAVTNGQEIYSSIQIWKVG